MTFWRKREKERMGTVRPGPGLWWELPASTSAQKYAVTPEEERFFAAFYDALQNSRKSTFFKLTRMADGAISVRNDRAYIGKIKLHGRKTWMQYLTGLYDAEVVENLPLEEYIKLLRYWVKTA